MNYSKFKPTKTETILIRRQSVAIKNTDEADDVVTSQSQPRVPTIKLGAAELGAADGRGSFRTV